MDENKEILHAWIIFTQIRISCFLMAQKILKQLGVHLHIIMETMLTQLKQFLFGFEKPYLTVKLCKFKP